MELIDYFTLLVFFLAGLFVGYRIADHMHKAVMPDMLHRLGVTPEQLERVMMDLKREINDDDEEDETSGYPEVSIKIEQHNDTLYAFRKDNDQFLGQGTTKEALIERMGEKLRNVRLVVTPEDGAALIGHQNFNYDTGKKEFTQS